jgi:hypothetical protein
MCGWMCGWMEHRGDYLFVCHINIIIIIIKIALISSLYNRHRGTNAMLNNMYTMYITSSSSSSSSSYKR